MEDVSFQPPHVDPCLHTHTDLQKGLILKLETKFTEGVKIYATAG